ncbi:MAG: hydroxymethylbilane synthase, partial [Caulobacteraceae bacterium]
PNGARLGTASARRAAQALHARPDLSIVPLRGNVETSLRKLDAGEMEAILLAAAGLHRLGLSGRITEFLDPEETPPAPGQGALAVQVREADGAAAWLAGLDDRPTRLCVAAERGSLSVLEGSCKTAIGAFARIEAERLELTVEALTDDGARRFRRQGSVEITGEGDDAQARSLGERLGAEVAVEYRTQGVARLL